MPTAVARNAYTAPVVTPRRGARQLTDTAGSLKFDATFSIDGEPVMLSADLSKLKEEGINFNLDKELQLGSIADFGDWAADTLEVSKVDWNDLPSVLKDVVTAQVFLEYFHMALKTDHQKVDTRLRVDFHKDLIGKLKFESLAFEVAVERTTPVPP